MAQLRSDLDDSSLLPHRESAAARPPSALPPLTRTAAQSAIPPSSRSRFTAVMSETPTLSSRPTYAAHRPRFATTRMRVLRPDF